MKRILIATDGSPAALQAVELGLELAEEHHAHVTFVHVAPAADVLPVPGFAMAPPAPAAAVLPVAGSAMAGPVSVPRELDEHDRKSLDEALELAEERGVPALTRLPGGGAGRRSIPSAGGG